MKNVIIGLLVLFFSITSCRIDVKESNIVVLDSLVLDHIPSSKTFYFSHDNVYYQTMVLPENQFQLDCLSLKEKKLRWLKNINENMGINKGTIISTGEYVVPTLSPIVYIIDSQGGTRNLMLNYRCKIQPIAFESSFILQDRGIGLRSFDSKTLNENWRISQNSNNTMSQPLLLNQDLIFILDDKSINSVKALNGKNNWKILLDSSFVISMIYGFSADNVYVLSKDLQDRKYILSIDYKKGSLVWKTKVDNSVDLWQYSMVVFDNIIYCKGDSDIIKLNQSSGLEISKTKYNSSVSTNLIKFKNDGVCFGLENNTLMLSIKDKDFMLKKFNSKLDQLYSYQGNMFLYSYPKLYLIGER